MTLHYPFRVVLSNEMQALAHRLGEELFLQGGFPFENRLVVVPDTAIKDFLLEQLVAHPQLKIAAGVRVLPLTQAVAEILDQVFHEEKRKIPSSIELALAIEEKLHAIDEPSLKEYFQGNSKRIASFSDELAKIFGRYGLHGSSFLPEWLKKHGWKQTLWRSLFSEETRWTYPLQALSAVQPRPFPGKLALFGFSYLTPAHLTFFATLGATLYHLSPSQMFWGDMASDKERKRMREELKEDMRADHPLLSNWGKVGRKMLANLDSYSLVEDEIYKQPVKEMMLARLKKSMLDLEPLDAVSDDSVQLHSATSRLREVEALSDTLQTLLQNEPIAPSDILVLCPDISLYAPYIQMVFPKSGIKDIPAVQLSPSIQGFFQLLSLDRFAIDAVVELLQNGSLLQKWNFAPDEMERICKWLRTAEVREKLMGDANSWEAGIERLLLGMAFSQDAFDAAPLACIPGSEVELFDRFLMLFEQIKSDLNLLTGKKSAAEWLQIFSRMAENYFVFDKEGESFFQELRILSHTGQKSPVWDFASIQRIALRLAQKPIGEISSAQIQKITFASLRSDAVKPARIISCLGMDEGSFPRTESRSSLCDMGPADYPAKVDEDRALFLDLLLKAGDYLIFSYQRVHAEDNKAQGPSVLIEELGKLTAIDHPAFPFDAGYFAKEAKIKKWSEIDFLAAKAHYSPTEQVAHPFFSDTPVEKSIVDMRQLKKLGRHPLQFYFNETLKIYLDEDEDAEEKEFLISSLRKSILRKKGVHKEIGPYLKQLRASGKLPSGLFQEAARRDLEREVGDLLSTLKTFSVPIEEVRVQSVDWKGRLVGKLEDVTPKGLLYHGEGNLKDLVKAWPLFLAHVVMKGEPKLLMTKSGEEISFPSFDAERALDAYLDYFHLAKGSPSPLMPDWAAALLQKGEADFAKALEKDPRYDDAYLSYLKRRHGLFDPGETFQKWSPRLRQIFSPLLEADR